MNIRSQLIICLLRQLHEVHPHGMRLQDLTVGCRSMGFPQESPATLESTLADCEEKGLVISRPDPLDESVKVFRRTEKGRVQLAELGHA